MYNRALRRDPLLEGRLRLEMVISASGEITELTLVNSEFHDPGLRARILARIRMIRFEAEDVPTTRVNYSFDFLSYSLSEPLATLC